MEDANTVGTPKGLKRRLSSTAPSNPGSTATINRKMTGMKINQRRAYASTDLEGTVHYASMPTLKPKYKDTPIACVQVEMHDDSIELDDLTVSLKESTLERFDRLLDCVESN